MTRHDIILKLDPPTEHATLTTRFTCSSECRETHEVALKNPHQVSAFLIDLAFRALACEQDARVRQLILTQAARKFTLAGRGEGSA